MTVKSRRGLFRFSFLSLLFLLALDNQHNAEFAKRLEEGGRFEEPIRLKIGKYDPAELVIFFKIAKE